VYPNLEADVIETSNKLTSEESNRMVWFCNDIIIIRTKLYFKEQSLSDESIEKFNSDPNYTLSSGGTSSDRESDNEIADNHKMPDKVLLEKKVKHSAYL
jgi:hypothetical protein